MINQIINTLSSNSPCQFELVEQDAEQFSFYRSMSSNYHRFLAVVKVSKLMKPNELNQWVLANTPHVLREHPTFAKNTDVVVLFELDRLADIIDHESEVFSLEEDGFSFKKHVLYYSQTELDLLNEIDTRDFANLIKDQSKFSLYKKSPLVESEYGIASRIFIKLPFLSVPVDESELDDPCKLADDYLKNVDLLALNNEFEALIANNGNNYQAIVEDYIRGKMANSQAKD
ncbi:ABC-three component system middle component 1 [Vibrio sp. YT-17]|uniref:ABC-three component system middle component 1 n=1 Tax=Vibrio sp. YT-17 TaxID=3074708 RepID=UPI0029656242|nr:ABC-three component system middle component 1 [Vibrio sp. YT-17]MDW1539138.1 ABC-three component system middle component 1 [Vibrio sp. YT-17]